ncbi:MAG: GAF domain-containing protein [Stigonema ocellatum SAG 48.90 = DSM 106950]|nr:GAF domain-containing protein [Stigonema ocellatum SAG 48.90 = DSM 106950]
MTPITENYLLERLEQENLLRRIINSIRQTLDLQDILARTVTEVRWFLKTDRVKIYKFHSDDSGQVIAESVDDHRLPSLLGLNFPADDIPPHARELFIKSRVRSVVNVDTRQIGQSHLHSLENGETISEDIRYRPVDRCHMEYLTAMGVKSSLVAPILYQKKLWGLLVSHHSEPHSVGKYDIEVVQMVVDQLSVAIAQSVLLTQTHERAKREAIINGIASLLHSLPTIKLQPALEEAVNTFGGSGGRLCIRDEAANFRNGTVKNFAECLELESHYVKVYTYGQQPLMPDLARYRLMEQYSVWQEHYKSGDYNIWAISDIYQIPELRNLQVAFRPTKIRSIVMIPLKYHQQLLGYLSIFRDEIDTETLWAGQFDLDQRQLYPRLSFEVWRESKKAQASQWTADEIALADALGKQFATAIYEYELYQQVSGFNTTLENQVKERTVQLQQAAEQQQALFGVVAKIRESLDVDTIFQTTTKEVCQLLQTDRVAVYRFNPDWGGEFIYDFEIAGPAYGNLVKLTTKTVWNDTYLQETQGGRYRNHESFVVDDIYQAGYSKCHIEILEQFSIKAYALAPIFVGQKLWGLLVAYQHLQPRHWEASEINFLSQTAAQLGVALQQTQLLAQTQQQAEQLAQALYNLKQTQAQLIQTEKMSSLGQLVAGVAHEINNPVSFISGNITYVSEYAQDLLSILTLYQQHYPNPCPEILQHAEETDLDFIMEDLPNMLSSMKIGTERISQIVLSLRNFSRLDQAEMKSVDIHEGIDSTLLILQHRLKATLNSPGIEVIKEYDDLPLVECYPGELNQVFINVLSNAIDALEEGVGKNSPLLPTPQIRIRTEVLDSNRVLIRIADNGGGIQKDIIGRVFDPFFTTKPVGRGTGLGLSISYQIIVNKHGGVLKCDSQQGLGTELWIEIPTQQITKSP